MGLKVMWGFMNIGNYTPTSQPFISSNIFRQRLTFLPHLHVTVLAVSASPGPEVSWCCCGYEVVALARRELHRVGLGGEGAEADGENTTCQMVNDKFIRD